MVLNIRANARWKFTSDGAEIHLLRSDTGFPAEVLTAAGVTGCTEEAAPDEPCGRQDIRVLAFTLTAGEPDGLGVCACVLHADAAYKVLLLGLGRIHGVTEPIEEPSWP